MLLAKHIIAKYKLKSISKYYSFIKKYFIKYIKNRENLFL
jgi:hypothetical protein